MWTGTGDFKGTSLIQHATAYGGLTEIQEDGAPGHGYSNKTVGKPATAEHNRFSAAASAAGFSIHKQSANSPELNDLDLGVWKALEARVELEYKKFLPRMKKKQLLNKLFEVISEAWESLPPEVLFSIAEHKVDVARTVLELSGKQLAKEPHGGARKRAKLAAAEAARG